MSGSEQKSIGDILEYYSREVVPAIAAAITIDDVFPEEVLNEIRASYTHLARAHNVGETDPDHQRELDSAYRHLKRSCLDSLKVCIFVTAQRCEKAVEALEYDHQLPNGIHRRTSELREQRKKMAAHEGQHPTHSVIEDLKSLLDNYDQFYTDLDKEFAGKTAEDRKNIRKSKQLKDRIFGFIMGIIGSIVAGLIYDIFL